MADLLNAHKKVTVFCGLAQPGLTLKSFKLAEN